MIGINTLINSLMAKFDVRDMGPTNFFLGVELIPHPNRCLLSKHKYMLDILRRVHMEDAKSISTPIAVDVTLSNSSYG